MSESIDKSLESDDDYVGPSSHKDLISALYGMLSSINYKIAIILYIICTIIFSDIFTDIIGRMGYVEDGNITGAGTHIQLMLVTICYIIIDLLVKNSII